MATLKLNALDASTHCPYCLQSLNNNHGCRLCGTVRNALVVALVVLIIAMGGVIYAGTQLQDFGSGALVSENVDSYGNTITH